MIRFAAVAMGVLLLAACKPAEPKQVIENPTPQAVVAPIAVEPILPGPLALTPQGWGAIQIGMREPEALKRVPGLKGDPPPHDEDWIACHQLRVDGQPDLYVMVEEEDLTRVTISGASKLKTDKGLGIGATEAEVKAAYGESLKVEPHKYEGPAAKYLTSWNPAMQRGVRYETNDKGVVTAIHAGMGSIELVEGCS